MNNFQIALLGWVRGVNKAFCLKKALVFADDINSGSDIITGSYIGTGTAGENNPNSLTFPFVPSIFCIYASGLNNGPSSNFWIDASSSGYRNNIFVNVNANFPEQDTYLNGGGVYMSYIRQSHYGRRSGTTLYWYSVNNQAGGNNPDTQFNRLNTKYYYFAIS